VSQKVAFDIGFSYKRLNTVNDLPDAKFELMPINLSFEYIFGADTDRDWDLFVGLGPSLVVFSERHPSNKKGEIVRGTHLAVETMVGLRIDTGLIEPRLAPAPQGLDGIEIEVFGARRTQFPTKGFDLGAWRGGLGVVFRL
jgi:hypothetical protein